MRQITWGALLLLALLAVGVAPVHAAPRPAATTVPATPGPRVGTLRLAHDTITAGTTTLPAVLEGFRPGSRADVTATSDTSGGPLTLYPGGVLIGPDGTAPITLQIPAIAPEGSYTVRANDPLHDTSASAFLTISAAPTPVASPGPIGAPSVVAPSGVTLAVSGTTPLTLAVSNFAPGASISVTIQALSGGYNGGAPLTLGTFGPLDGRGAGAGAVDLPSDITPGNYSLAAVQTTGIAAATTSLTIAINNANALSGWDRSVWAGLWKNATEGALSFVNTTVQAGRSALVTAIAGVALHVEDWTDAKYTGIYDLAAPFLIWSGGVLTFAVAVRTFLTVRRAKSLHDVESLLGVAVELTAVITVVGSLKLLESAVWGWTGAQSAWFVRGGLDKFGAVLDRWTNITPHDIASTAQWGLALFMALAMEFVMAVQLVALGLTRLGGDGFLIFLWLSGALCAATYALERTRGLALTWLRTIVAISLWPVLWGWLFGAEGSIIDAFTGAQPTSFQDVFLKVAIAVTMLLGFNAVPEVLRLATRHVLPGPGSEVDGTRTPFHRLGQTIKSRVPVLGRL